MYFSYVECSQPLGAQQDPLELELDEGSHRTLIILVRRCMSSYIQRHLSTYSQTRNVQIQINKNTNIYNTNINKYKYI